MTTWDATAKDLADALTARGRRPLDADHLFTCAVAALEDLDDMVSQEDHEHVVKGFRSDLEEMERNEQTASDRADEVERERDELQEQVDALESERDDLQVENTNLREALNGDAEVLVGQVARLKRDLEREREEIRGLLARLRERLVSLQRHVDVPRISKATVSVNLRDVVAALDHEIARASAK